MGNKDFLKLSWVLILSFCSGLAFADERKFQNVSIVQLIANFDKFDGKDIETVGWIYMDHSSAEPGAFIFLTKEDMEAANILNGFTIDLKNAFMQDNLRLNRKMVLVRGLFKKQGGEGLLHDLPGISAVAEIKEKTRPAIMQKKKYYK